MFKKRYKGVLCPTTKQVYNWIKNDKIRIKKNQLCYKKSRSKKKNNSMIRHTLWNLENKTVLPISLRPKYIEERNEPGHLEIDSIVGKRNEHGLVTIN